MKKPANFSDTITRGATEAREVIQQTAGQIEAEWKRIVSSIEESDTVPGQVKVVFDRLDGTVGDVKEFVATNGPKVMNEGVRVAQKVGVPIPEDWADAWTADSAEDAADAPADHVEDDVVDAEIVAEDDAPSADDAADAADTTDEKADDKADDKA